MLSFPSSLKLDSIATKSASSFSKMDVMAGVSWEGSITENLGRSERSRKGLLVAVADSAAVRVSADILRAVLLDDDDDDDDDDEQVEDDDDEAVLVLRAR
jgi:hypothetical protein